MTLKIGPEDASDGMSKDIYEAMNEILMTDKIPDENRADVQEGWKKLAFAVAKGVINHLTDNLEIDQVKTGGNVNASVSGNTAPGGADNHTHGVSLSAVQNNVQWNQTANGKVKKWRIT